MTVRVGHIEFLNCYPLYFGLEQRAAEGLAGEAAFELVPGVPTGLNRMLLSGTIDFGPISSIEYGRGFRQLRLSRRLSISSKGAVDSIQLVSRRPLEEVERIALTPKSATSVTLLKTIMKLKYGLSPVYDELLRTPEEALRDHDAVLLIGDEALEALYFPLPDTRLYDLGHLWREWTGHPMVYAVWAARDDYLGAHSAELLAVEDELVRSMDYSREAAPRVVQAASGLWRFDRPCLDRYFQVLHYGFSEEYREGLRRFFELAYEAGELADVPELRFFGDDGEVGAGADRAAGRLAGPGRASIAAGRAGWADRGGAGGSNPRGHAAHRRGSRDAAAFPRPPDAGAARRREAGDAGARRRGHLHHRPEHQLHQHLPHRVRLLRLLPLSGDGRRVSAGQGGDLREDRRDPGSGWHGSVDAGRSSPRSGYRLLRRPFPLHQGALRHHDPLAVAAGDHPYREAERPHDARHLGAPARRRLGLVAGRWRGDPGGPGAATRGAQEGAHRALAAGDAGSPRVGHGDHRHDDVRQRGDPRGAGGASAPHPRSSG